MRHLLSFKRPCFGAVFALFFLVPLFPQSIFAHTNLEVQVERVIMDHGETGQQDSTGLVTIGYDPGEQDMYVSIGAYDPITQAFAIILSNMYLPGSVFSPERQYIAFPFQLTLLATRAALFPRFLEIYVHFFLKPALYPFDPSTHVATLEVPVTDLIDDATGVRVDDKPVDVQIGPTPEDGVAPGDEVSEIYYRGCDVPNLDLDDSKYPDTAAYAGDRNACVPAATANSLLWLDKTFGIFYGFPPSHHDLVDSLSRYMQRERNEGTYPDKLIKGKVDFFAKRRMQIKVQFQSRIVEDHVFGSDGESFGQCMNTGDDAFPTWEFLKEAMKESCDVEINYRARNADGNWYGHSVVCTGVMDYERAGLRYIHFKHDKKQSGPGGTKQEGVRVWEDEEGKLRIEGRRDAWIKDIVAECPVRETTGVERQSGAAPGEFELLQNYPNPFNASTTIAYRLAESSTVQLRIFSLSGEEVFEYRSGVQTPGEHRIVWEASDTPSGIYIYQILAGNQMTSRKLALMK